MKEKFIYIVGHKNPDTDSICSAIAYAYLKNTLKKNPNHNYIACRSGAVNEESQFVLNYFGVEEPTYLRDAATQVKEIEIHESQGINCNITVKKAWNIMRERNVVTLVITTAEDHIQGMITVSDIARSYMDSYDNTTLSKARTEYKDIAETLDGEVIVGNEHAYFQKGRVMIGSFHPDMMENFIKEDDLVIVGNRTEDQLCAIDINASCIIVGLGARIAPSIRRLAEQSSCVIISSPHDTYTIARLINQAIPVKYLMRSKNLITFNSLDRLDDIKEIMSNSRHRDYPILNEDGKYIGTISRRNLIGAAKKRLILVDHNEKSQAPDHINEAEITEIIDHHRLGSLETMAPLLFRNQPVGCTATIIRQMYQEQGVEIPKEIAGLLLSAILSDTLLFRSPTCTPLDQRTAEELAVIAGIADIKEYATEMFRAGGNLGGKSDEEIINQDFKEFVIEKTFIGVGQIISMSSQDLQSIKDRLQIALKQECEKRGCEMVFFMLTNILDETTDLIYYGDKAAELIETAFDVKITDGSALLPDVVSRKKQLIPAFMQAMQI